MANVITCPKCERQLRVPDELLGQSVKCPSCSETFTASLPKQDSPPPPPSRVREEEEERPSRRRPIRRRDDDDDDDDDRGSRRRRHLSPHRGDTIQLLGILSFFLVPLVLGPCAWIMGNGDLAEMDAGRMDPAGRKATETGRMCGKIATIIHGSFLLLIPLFALGWCCCMGVLGSAGSAGGHPKVNRLDSGLSFSDETIMANVVTCPSCQRQLRVPDELVGTRVLCPTCRTNFRADVPSSSAEDRPRRRSRPGDDDDDDDRGSFRIRQAPHRGDTIQLLGILSFFLVPLVLGPVAWIMGNGDLAEMDAGRMDPAGRKATETGRLCGKIATIVWSSIIAAVMLIYVGIVLFVLILYGTCCCFGLSAGAAGAGQSGS